MRRVLEPVRKAVRVAALAMGLMVLAMGLSAGANDAVVGSWAMKMDYQGTMIDATLTINEAAGALGGTWESAQGKNDLKNVKFENGTLTFTRSISFQDQTFDLEYSGKVEGGKLTGLFTTPMGDMTAGGEKQGGAAPAGGAASLPGVWELTVESQLGVNKRKLTIDDTLNGSYEADYGTFKTANMKLDGNKATFDLTLSMDGQELPFKFEGTVDGDTLKGQLKSDMGDAIVTGTRAPVAAADQPLSGPVELEGAWKMSIQTPDGTTNDGEMIVTTADGKLAAVITTEVGDIKIPDVKIDGNTMTFAADVDFGGVMVPVSFKGSTGGPKMKGIVTLNFEGQEMALPIEGEKLKGLRGPVNLVGDWTLLTETPDGATSESHIKVETTEGKLFGLLSTELGEAKIENIVVDGNNVSFVTSVDFGGTPVPLSFAGTSGGDALEGVVKVTFEGADLELPLKGTRAAAAAPAATAPAAAPAPVASACCTKPTCGAGCKGSAGCGACCTS